VFYAFKHAFQNHYHKEIVMFKSVIKTITTVAVLSGLSLACYADSYASASFGFVDIEETVALEPLGTPPLIFDSSLTSLYGRIGKQYTENFSAEVRLGLGLGDDVVEFEGVDTGAKLEIREFYGAYLRGGMRMAETVYPYVIVGYTQATLEWIDDSVSVHDGFGGVSYGAGLDIEVKRDLFTSIEYMHYFDTVGIELTGFSVGLTKSF